MGYDELAFFFKSVMLDRMRAIAHIILRLMDVKKALVLKCFFSFFVRLLFLVLMICFRSILYNTCGIH